MSQEPQHYQQYRAADEQFLDALTQLGLEINGVKAAFTPGKGRGIVADRHGAQEGDRLVHVPSSSILAVPKTAAVSASQKSASSVHSLLSLKLLQGDVPEHLQSFMGMWRSVMPDLEILKQCVPLLWSARAQQLLPEPAKALLQRQKTKFQRDWNDFRSMKLPLSAFGLLEGSSQSAVYEAFAHAWLLVNTRSFYWDYPTTQSQGSKRARQKSQKSSNGLGAEDCMALVPFIDLFNHTYVGECVREHFPMTNNVLLPPLLTVEQCAVEFNNTGFTVVAARDYGNSPFPYHTFLKMLNLAEPGEEVFVTYGNYGNEFLLVEYGFMMDPNVCDTVALDQYVIPEFNKAQRALVEEANMFGNYNLHASNSPSNVTPPTYCYRTQCALRALVLPPAKAKEYIDSGGESGSNEIPDERKKIDDMWKHICGHVFENVLKCKNSVETDLAEGAPQEILLARWNQISDMVYDTIED
ncbi:MAG: hypothetical protein Q9159_003990 [Coniocarpon cinnabarinum]